jgi:ribosomal protein L7Ae-like RNA K-turn-binding protein
MAVDAILGLLGLSRKAGKLAYGEEQVRDMVASGKCRVIFLASDAGDATRRKVERHDIRVPVLTLPWDRETLGNAIGIKRECTVCAINDIGMANAIAGKLVNTGAANQRAAERVAEKKARIDFRKHKKKKENGDP